MKVIAKHRINHNGEWHVAGDVFEVEDYEAVKDFVEIPKSEYVSDVFPPEETATETPKRRGRPKK